MLIHRPASPTLYNQYLNFCRVHGYKLLAAFAISFIFIQYFSGFASYHHRFLLNLPPKVPWASGNNLDRDSRQESKLSESSSHPFARRPLKLSLLKEENLETKREQIVLSNVNETLVSNQELDKGSEFPTASQKEMCPLVPPKLVGRVKVLTESPSFEKMEELYSSLEPGGRFRPQDCLARHKVAIIIPYRDREEHLRTFLYNMHPILMRQQVDYGIYIVEEIPKARFNRAKLMNVGFKEALKQYDYQCFIFHDVDLLPEDDRNLYTCPDQPRHMSVAVDTMNYRLPYKDIFGGVSAVTKGQMEKVNGYSNQFWGWGGEDDDFSNRIRHHGFRISRYPSDIARYKMLRHKKDTPNPERYQKLYKGRLRFKTDGLNSLKYERKKVEFRKLYTWVLVDLLEETTKKKT